MKTGEKKFDEFEELVLELDMARIIFAEEEEEEARIVVSIKDITERKLAESQREAALEALQKSEEKYRNIFNDAILGIYQTTPEGRILGANPALVKMFGYDTPEELTNVTATQIYANPEDREIFKGILSKDGVVEKFETRFRKRSGETIWVSINACIVKDRQGNISNFEGTIEDITERKRAEEALRKNQEQLRDAHRLAHIGIWNWIADTDTVTWTEELYRIAGLDPMITAPTYAEHPNIYTPESWDRLKAAVEKTLETGASYQLELELIRPDGTTRWVNAFGGATYDNHGRITGLRGTVQDITEHKQAEEYIKRRNDELAALNVIAATVSSSLDLQEILDQGLDKMLEVTGLEVGSIYLLDQKTEDLVLVTYRGTSEEYADQMRTFKMGESLVGKVAQTGEPIVVDDLTRDPRVTTTLVTKEKMCSFAGIPIKSKESVLGVMNAASRQYHSFSPREIQLYTAIADLLAAAIENARLYGVVKKELTERKQIADTLSKSKALLIEAQGVAHIGHWELDTSTMTTTWSEEIFHIFSLDPEEGEPSFEAHQKVIHTDDWGILNNAMTTTIVEGISFDIMFRILRPDKTIRWMHAIGYPKKDSEGRIVSVFGTAQDITDRRLIEEALWESEEHYRILTEKTIAGIYLVQDGLLRYVNPTFCSIHGYTRGELVDKLGPLDLVVEEEREFLKDKIQQRLSGEHESGQFSIRIRRNDGEIRFLEVFSSYALYAGKPTVLGTCIDMTEARKANEAIKKSREELRSLTAYLQNVREEERTRIAREIHDELGQSLTGIKIDISWLKKKLADIVKPTDPIQTKIDSLIGLTESVISTTRELSLNLRPGILDDLGFVAAIKWEIKRFQEKTGIICTFQSDMEEKTLAEDYATTLFRICQECLTNITRHAHATEVKITFKEKKDNLALAIEDNGKGIITEQIRSPLSLGILGMKERVVGFKGRFHISGAPGKGTKVKVELPVR